MTERNITVFTMSFFIDGLTKNKLNLYTYNRTIMELKYD